MATEVQNIQVKTEEDAWELLSETASTVGLDEAVQINPGDLENAEPLDVSGNPIGELQELCVSRGWAPPAYEDRTRTGPPHLPTFFIACKLNGITCSASATSKKQAKKAAAARMLQKVNQNISGETRPPPSVAKGLSEIENTLNQLTITADSNVLEMMSAADVEKQLSILACRSNVVLTSRAGSDIEGRSIWIVEIDGHTVTGYGKTPQEARMDAAKGVVDRLRMKLLNDN